MWVRCMCVARMATCLLLEMKYGMHVLVFVYIDVNRPIHQMTEYKKLHRSQILLSAGWEYHFLLWFKSIWFVAILCPCFNGTFSTCTICTVLLFSACLLHTLCETKPIHFKRFIFRDVLIYFTAYFIIEQHHGAVFRMPWRRQRHS